ncbi:unnamed protein product [Porites lobata]|uniref:RING-type domain-containing protein n=1 Tax=Porites lobata TaxID=104759 RepID=A0ABN8N2G0_9CNID|nr:unnamed protein product [Porites lobata]
MPGFSVKILTEKLPGSKFLCEWCGSLLRGAKKASCGHFFCSSCVDNLLCENPGRVSYCPRSNRPLFHDVTEFWPADAAFCDELHDLGVHCKECSWSGKLQNFEHHSGTCDFNSYPKQQEQFVREENPCSQKEVYSNEVDGYCELLKLGAASCVTGQQHRVGTNDVNSNCTEEKKQGNERSQTEGKNNQLDDELLKPAVTSNVRDSDDDPRRLEASGGQLGKCKYCEVQVNPSVMELHYKECEALLVVIDKCGKDNNHQEKVKEMNYKTSLLPLSRKVLPACNLVGEREQITSMEKDVSLANADNQGASSYHFPDEQNIVRRLRFLENKVAQHDFLFEENRHLKQEIQRISSALCDFKRKIECIEEMSADSRCWRSDCFKAIWETFEALKLNQSALQAQMENPASRELHVKLTRTMRSIAAMQEQIRNLEQHTLSHGNMLGNLSNAVTSLANEVRELPSERIFDIEGV